MLLNGLGKTVLNMDGKISNDNIIFKQELNSTSRLFNSSEAYNSLCTEYYDIAQPAPEGAISFYLNYARQAKGRILEPMCGTGIFLIPIMEAGLEIEGLDASRHMIKALIKKSAQKNLYSPLVRQGLLQNLHRPETYNLVIIPTGSINLLSEDCFKAGLQRIYESLIKDCLLVFEVCTPYWEKSINISRYYVEVYPTSKNKKIVASFSYSKPQNQTVEVVCRYELFQDNKLIETELEVETLRLYNQEEIFSLLLNTGFSNIKTIKRFDINKLPNKEDKIIIYECKK